MRKKIFSILSTTLFLLFDIIYLPSATPPAFAQTCPSQWCSAGLLCISEISTTGPGCFTRCDACPGGQLCPARGSSCPSGGGSGTCSDTTDNPSGTSLPGQQADFTNLLSQIGTQSTCNDSVVTNRTDYCSSAQLVEHYCVVNSAFPTGRCFETLGTCPSGQTCRNNRCESTSGGTTCTDNDGDRANASTVLFTSLNISTRGTCTSPASPGGITDGCFAGQHREFFCDTLTNECLDRISACPAGTTLDCTAGACVSSGGGTYPAPTSGGGSSGPFGVGAITPGFSLPLISSGNENVFVAGLVRNGIGAMILIAFIVALIWLILAGFKFILANGEPKEVSAAWSQIRYSLIGLAIIMSAYAIIIMVETFFKVDIIGGGLRLPTRTS